MIDLCPHYLLAKQAEIQWEWIVAEMWKVKKNHFYVFYDEIKSCFKE